MERNILLVGYKAVKIPFWVKFWNKQCVLGVTNRKLPALAYIDDRAINLDGDLEKIYLKIEGLNKK